MRGFCFCGGQVSAFVEIAVAVRNGFLTAIDKPGSIHQITARHNKVHKAWPVEPPRLRAHLFREHDKGKDPQYKENPKLGVRHGIPPLIQT